MGVGRWPTQPPLHYLKEMIMNKRNGFLAAFFLFVLLSAIFACRETSDSPPSPQKLGGNYPLNFINLTNSPAPTAVASGHVYAWQDPNLAFATENSAGFINNIGFSSGDGGLGSPNPQAHQVLSFENTTQTVGLVTQNIITIPLALNTSATFWIVVNARDVGSGMIWQTIAQLGATNIAGTLIVANKGATCSSCQGPPLLGTAWTTRDGGSDIHTANLNFVVSGANLILQVIGVASDTINWEMFVTTFET
jgi:hypothetical protein